MLENENKLRFLHAWQPQQREGEGLAHWNWQTGKM